MGSCNACTRGVVKKGENHLTYPYQYVYELRIGQPHFSQAIRFCSKCLVELRDVIK